MTCTCCRKTSVSVSTSEQTRVTRLRLTPQELANLATRYPTHFPSSSLSYWNRYFYLEKPFFNFYIYNIKYLDKNLVVFAFYFFVIDKNWCKHTLWWIFAWLRVLRIIYLFQNDLISLILTFSEQKQSKSTCLVLRTF